MRNLLFRSLAVLTAVSAVHLTLAACSPPGSAHAEPDIAAWEPCILGVADHGFPGVTLASMAAVHVVIKTGHGPAVSFAQAPAFFVDQHAFVNCPERAEAALFVLP